MAVAHDSFSESHTGTVGSISEASFSWTHTPVSTLRGVQVKTFNRNSTGDNATAVTYGGVAMTAVTGGRAVDTAEEPSDCKLWELGSGIPSGAQTVVVTRVNNTDEMYATCVGQTAAADTAVVGIVLLENNGTLAEQSVDDGSPGTNSVRYAGLNSGLAAVPAAGASSTALGNIDYGTHVIMVVRETTAGQGARSVGFSSGSVDDRAAVHYAVKELAAAGDSLRILSPFTELYAPARPAGALQ